MSDVEKVADSLMLHAIKFADATRYVLAMQSLPRSTQVEIKTAILTQERTQKELHNAIRAALSALGGWNEAVEAAAQIAENHRLAHAKGGPRDDAAYCFKSAEIRDQIRALRRPATGEG